MERKRIKWKVFIITFFGAGYSVDTVGKNKTAARQYIKNQMEEDYAKDQKRQPL